MLIFNANLLNCLHEIFVLLLIFYLLRILLVFWAYLIEPPLWDYIITVVMSPSWNFPARAEPSYKVSEPSWGISISELKPSCQFFLCKAFLALFSCFYLILNQQFSHFNNKNQYLLQKTAENRVIKVQVQGK